MQYNIMSKTSGKEKSQKKIIGEYEVYLDKVLGVGGFGKVLEGYDTKKKEKVAVKMIKKDSSGQGAYQLKALERQFMIQYKLSSNHIVGLMDIISTKNYNYIIQQKCDEDLDKYLSHHKKISEGQAIEFMTQILQGFYALIVTNVIHRDVKPQNILIKNGMLKLTDFGLSRKISNDELMTSVVGTKIYKAPQLIQGSNYTTKCDIWSLGTLFYEMLFGTKLFGKVGSDLKILSQMREIDKNLDFPVEPSISQESKTILRRCLRFREDDRADWNYLFSHPYFCKKIPNLDKLHIGLNQIISIIRKQIDVNNIDLEKFFKRFGFTKNSELKFDTYSSMILKLISYKKISVEQIRFSFNYFDRDGSGKITFNEFYNTLQKYDVKMVATARDQAISKLVTVVSKIQDKDTEASGNESNEIDLNESYSKQEMDLLSSSQKAYGHLISELRNKQVNIVQAFHLQDIAELGLNLMQFQQFLSQKLGVLLPHNQSKLIFEKMDEDNNKKIEAREFFKFVCQDLNIPYLIDLNS